MRGSVYGNYSKCAGSVVDRKIEKAKKKSSKKKIQIERLDSVEIDNQIQGENQNEMS